MAEAESSILIVDDDAEDLSALEGALDSLGCEIHTVSDPHDVLPAVYREQPDVVILDALLPGLSGFDLCKQIKTDSDVKGIQVVIITGVYLRQQYRQEALQQFKADGFLTKPFRAPELQRLVVQLLSKKTRKPQSSFLSRLGLPAAAESSSPRKRGLFGRLFGKSEAEPPPSRIAPVGRDRSGTDAPSQPTIDTPDKPPAEAVTSSEVSLEETSDTDTGDGAPTLTRAAEATEEPESDSATEHEGSRPAETAAEPAPSLESKESVPAEPEGEEPKAVPETEHAGETASPSPSGEEASSVASARENEARARASEAEASGEVIEAPETSRPGEETATLQGGDESSPEEGDESSPEEAVENRNLADVETATSEETDVEWTTATPKPPEPPPEATNPAAEGASVPEPVASQPVASQPLATETPAAGPETKAEMETERAPRESREPETESPLKTVETSTAPTDADTAPPAATPVATSADVEAPPPSPPGSVEAETRPSASVRRPRKRVDDVPIYDEDDFRSELKRELSKCRRVDRPLTLIVIQVGDLTQIVELFGQEIREGVLWHVAEQAMSSLREVDLVGMISSKDLIALTAFASDKYGGGRVVTRMRKSLTKNPFKVGDELPPIVPELRFGMSSFPDDGEDSEALMSKACADL